MTSGPIIDYEALQQEAMRSVVRSVLKEIERNGLPGDHHFYISFNTRAPGVILSRRLREKYQSEMTIVLQHRFWGLVVAEDRFEVNLTFDGIPERLVVPFQAIRVFVDPSVRYGLQFETSDIGPDPEAFTTEPTPEVGSAEPAADGTNGPAGDDQAAATLQHSPRKARTTTKRSSKSASRSGGKKKETADAAVAEGAPAEGGAEDTAAEAAGGANVVSLDAFRKR